MLCCPLPYIGLLAGKNRHFLAKRVADDVLRLVDAGSAALAAAAAAPPRVRAAAAGSRSGSGDAARAPLDPAAARLFLRLQQAAARVELKFSPGRRVLGPPGNLLGRAMAGLPPGDALALAAAWHARGGSFSRGNALGLLAALEAQPPDAARSFEFERAARELCAIWEACAEHGRLPRRYIGPLIAGLLAALKRNIEAWRAEVAKDNEDLRTVKKLQKKGGAAAAAAAAAAIRRLSLGSSLTTLPPALIAELLAALTGSPARCRAWRDAPDGAKLVPTLVRWQLVVAPRFDLPLPSLSAMSTAHAMWQADVPCGWRRPVLRQVVPMCTEQLQRKPTDVRGLRSTAVAAGALAAFSRWQHKGGRDFMCSIADAIRAAHKAQIDMEPWVSQAAFAQQGCTQHWQSPHTNQMQGCSNSCWRASKPQSCLLNPPTLCSKTHHHPGRRLAGRQPGLVQPR